MKNVFSSSLMVGILTFFGIFSLPFSNTFASNSGGSLNTGSTEKIRKIEQKEAKDTLISSSDSGASITKKAGIGESDNEEDVITTTRIESEKKLRQEINTYIIESYKAQGNKIIKDLTTKLTKSIPDTEARKVAYERIRSSLNSRIEITKESQDISDTRKDILIEFLRHLSFLLERKIEEIEK